MPRTLNAAVLAATLVLATAPALGARAQTAPGPAPAPVGALARYQEAERLAAAHLATFDTLDFDVYSNQQ